MPTSAAGGTGRPVCLKAWRTPTASPGMIATPSSLPGCVPRYLSVSDLAAASVKAPNASPATFMPGQLSITRFQAVLTWLSTGSRRQRAHGEHVALAAEDLREVGRALGRGEVVVAVDVDRAVDGHRAQQGDGRDARVGRLLHRPVERVRRRRLEDDQVGLLLDEAVVLLQLLGDVEVAARGADLHLPHALRVGEVLLEVVDDLDLEVADQLAPGDGDGVRARDAMGFQSAQRLLRTLTVDPGKSA